VDSARFSFGVVQVFLEQPLPTGEVSSYNVSEQGGDFSRVDNLEGPLGIVHVTSTQTPSLREPFFVESSVARDAM
jgi:hypothetical protein